MQTRDNIDKSFTRMKAVEIFARDFWKQFANSVYNWVQNKFFLLDLADYYVNDGTIFKRRCWKLNALTTSNMAVTVFITVSASLLRLQAWQLQRAVSGGISFPEKSWL